MKNKFIIFLLILLAFVMKVDAMSLKPTGDSSGKPGNTLKVYITLERSASDKAISAVDGLMNWDSNVLTLSNQKILLNNWTQLSAVSDASKFSFGNLSFDNLLTEISSNIVELTFTVNSSAPIGNTQISISSASAVDTDFNGNRLAEQTHTINIASNLSSDNTLSSLKVNDIFVSNFTPSITNYTVSVANGVSRIKISSTLKDGSSSYVDGYGNREVEFDGDTKEILIKVKAQNGDIKTYTINVVREDVENIHLVSDIKINGYDFDFNNNVKEYNLKIENEKSLNINVLLTNNKYSYEINGNENLSNGKVITIKVNGDNKVEEYKINIITSTTNIKVPATSLNLPYIIMVSGIIFAVIGIVIIYIIRNKK